MTSLNYVWFILYLILLFHEYGCFACIFVYIPHVCMVLVKVRRGVLDPELGLQRSHPLEERN